MDKNSTENTRWWRFCLWKAGGYAGERSGTVQA